MEVIKGHFQDAFGDGNARGFLNRLCIVLEKKQGEREGGGGSDQSPGKGFEQVANSGLFRVGHDVKFSFLPPRKRQFAAHYALKTMALICRPFGATPELLGSRDYFGRSFSENRRISTVI